ncbi:hypothetical protein AWC38_SpisGene2093 [Stylophora pistillata]|uniref:SAP domain-containing protein n=1 Tax=Stylophora pistillata TaxID=50429 RepID=A0A2B4SV00_STYPI|nr:hypothetical protein AWC38_SpisGene2093 [Stylophora pistillata]
MEKRKADLLKLNQYRDSLSKTLSQAKKHEKELSFMAENGIRQVVYPRIVQDSPRERKTASSILSSYPEGAGERVRKSVLVREQHKVIQQAIGSAATSGSVSGNSDRKGCQLAFLARKIREHYNDKDKKSNNIATRLIGEQAVPLARYSFRLIDALRMNDESSPQRIKHLALGKAAQFLQDFVMLFSKVEPNLVGMNQLKHSCSMYFNLISLFFPDAVNLTVWTIGYAVPYHAELLYREYKPVPSTYTSHFKSQLPPPCKDTLNFCECGRSRDEASLCTFCEESKDIVRCAQEMKLDENLIAIFKPVRCETCETRFPDVVLLESHQKVAHSSREQLARPSGKINPQMMNVKELKEELRARGASLTGYKAHLIRRLEELLAAEVS